MEGEVGVSRRIGTVAPLVGATLVALASVGCDSATEPDRPILGFGQERTYPDRREVDVGWANEQDGARLAGTLYLPPDSGPHAALVIHIGSHRWTRASWNVLYSLFADQGIALLSYDKRGVGESEGECCPFRDPGYFPLLAGDVIGAVRAVAEHPDIDPARVGVYGFSQGGWVLPVAAAAAPDDIAVVFIGSGPVVTLGEELLYSQLTGDAMCTPTGLSDEEIDARLDSAGPSGFDPLPYIAAMPQPALWQYCAEDLSIPVDRSIAILQGIREADSKDFTIQRFPDCNHTFVDGGGMCEVEGVRVDWWHPLCTWLESRGFTGSNP